MQRKGAFPAIGHIFPVASQLIHLFAQIVGISRSRAVTMQSHMTFRGSCTRLPSRTTRQVAVAVAKPSKKVLASDTSWLMASIIAAPIFAAGPALAKGGELGILEGRTLALIHPAVMGSLFAYTCYAGWLGWQVRICLHHALEGTVAWRAHERASAAQHT
jgi:hypothetical protein